MNNQDVSHEMIGLQNSSKKAWLITWNPKNWDWENYDDVVASTQAGNILLVANLLCEEAITMENLSEFSEEFHKSLDEHRRIWGI